MTDDYLEGIRNSDTLKAQRRQLAQDVIVNAYESGMLAQNGEVTQYEWDDDSVSARVTIIYDDCGLEQRQYYVTQGTIVACLKRMYEDPLAHKAVGEQQLQKYIAAYIVPDDADLDAIDCDMLFQLATIGEYTFA